MSSTIASLPDILDNINNYSIKTEINDSGKQKNFSLIIIIKKIR